MTVPDGRVSPFTPVHDERWRPEAADPPVLLTKSDAARVLTVSMRQISRWLADGSLTPVRLGPRLVRFAPQELTAFVERQSAPPSPPVEWPTKARRQTLRRTA
jgi:excisionase family DNA binding protein